ncbi:DUF3040 domain-containing protein [Actinomadura hibisca]|uniref:DUF3040 domain-containing protein n=1 Tax=Actinomadura hibisca TaxID=68565 RepID=UPI00082CB729|nr:DUF3040 domain-containing protein [Actinomadura hibisca]
MSLSVAESRMLEEIARRTAADDPDYARRLDTFGGYEASALGLPTRWTLLPLVLVGALLVLGFVAASLATARNADAPSGRLITGSATAPDTGHGAGQARPNP